MEVKYDFKMSNQALQSFTKVGTERLAHIDIKEMQNKQADKLTLEDLTVNFIECCPDFADQLTMGAKSASLNFAWTMLYNVGPASRARKGDCCWTFEMPNKEGSQIKDGHDFAVVTMKNTDNARLNSNSFMSVRKATFLASMKMSEAANLIRESGPNDVKNYLLTPLTAACFDEKTVMSCSGHYGDDVVEIFNMSCSPFGHLHKKSDADIAIAAAMNAVRNMTDLKVRDSIVGKVIKQYESADKPYDKDHVMALLGVSKGIGCQKFSIDSLINETRELSLNGPKALRAHKSMLVDSKFNMMIKKILDDKEKKTDNAVAGPSSGASGSK
ncbi:nucleocapsid protein [Shuangao Insect Virus 2]|uniref:Nucleocapsid protein n=1 Tax=Shuangao Insect Virus 2 TaxID=1608076 RepID=A0A0B5KU51_9VIRU|nr:nucleopasid protein [Shuangao Insect Virus 2]AJG39312.1 nucleocapsid protein [Shuangao Insect Virus 2]